jgi:2OG-Fe(II) oxygenase superfamily
MSRATKTITIRKRITRDALEALDRNEVGAVRVTDFMDQKTCEAIAKRMLKSKHYGRYKNAPKIGRIGKALFECEAQRYMEDMRDACAPFANPIDLLRAQFDVIWPGGARIARLKGQPAFAGLLRVFSSGSYAEPHQDHLAWDVGPLGLGKEAFLKSQIAGNVYLKLPPRGGELMVWPGGLTREEYERARITGSYGVRQEALKGEPLVIRPQVGELILFPSTRTHSVVKSEGGDRVTWSCFIGSRGTDKPLEFWS